LYPGIYANDCFWGSIKFYKHSETETSVNLFYNYIRIENNLINAFFLYNLINYVLPSIPSICSILTEFLIGTLSGHACLYIPPSSPHCVSILRNKLTRWTFYVWYLLWTRLGSGFIESYIKTSGPEKSLRGAGRLARMYESTDGVLAFVSSEVYCIFFSP